MGCMHSVILLSSLCHLPFTTKGVESPNRGEAPRMEVLSYGIRSLCGVFALGDGRSVGFLPRSHAAKTGGH